MRKILWIILAVVFVTVGAPNAHADSYEATFICTTSCEFPPIALGVVSSGPIISMVDVSYFGYFFPITLNPVPYNDTFTWFAESTTAFSPPDRTISVDILDKSNGTDWYILYYVPNYIHLSDNTERGSLVFTPVATPEPRSLALMVLGIGVLLVLRNRLG
jgi:hypothetical protein